MASTSPPSQPGKTPARPDRKAAENAVHTLISWAVGDPTREGLLDTPARVVRSYEEFFPHAGAFRSDGSTRGEFLAMIGRTGAGPLNNT